MKDVATYINLCNRSIDWIAKYKSDQYEQRFLDIVEQRRVLRQILNTMANNPAIAAYGASQVGKSYLMSNLLQNDGKPFIVHSDGGEYDFIHEMNPITKKTEATGVVTRFTSYASCPDRYKAEHPIMMRTLSVADMVIVLAEGYYNDISDYTYPSEGESEAFANSLKEKYASMPKQAHPAVTADDVLDMKFYFSKYINNAQTFKKSCFFDKLALIIEHIPLAELHEVFSPIWNSDANITSLFKKFLNVLKQIDFQPFIYLPAEALLHHGDNKNTIMSVQCLNGLFDTSSAVTDAYLYTDGAFRKVSNLSKSELSGICAEVILKIPDEFLDSTAEYSFEEIADPGVVAALGTSTVKMDILKTIDLLDFPGARTRKQELAEKLARPEVMINVLLRGKVAYLFNKYSEASMLNILMYCHYNEKNEVGSIPLLLNSWVNKYIGSDPQSRAEKLQTLRGISPLFYIATMFNIDMKCDTENPEANRGLALDGRWEARFSKVLVNDCFGPSMTWWQDWTSEGITFNNSYLLRDYKYSKVGESNLFDGFDKTGREVSRVIPVVKGQEERLYFENMRESFIKSPHVRRFFPNPALSWDVAATMNNDGALYILQRLGQVCSLIYDFRAAQFAEDANRAIRSLYRAMADYYVSQDEEKILRDNIRKAKTIHREMDMACNDDNYFFGHLLQSLQLREEACLNHVHSLVQGNELNANVQNFKNYEILYTSCNGFKGCTNDEECWERLISVYGYFDIDDAKADLNRRKIDPTALFRRTFERKKNSFVIAGKIIDMWDKQLRSIDTLNQFTSEGKFDPVVMDQLVTKLLETAKELDLEKVLSEAIALYVNITNVNNINESMVANILTDLVNEFVLDLGYNLLQPETLTEVGRIIDSDPYLTLEYLNRTHPTSVSETYLTDLFDGLNSEPAPLTPAFENNYYRWLECIMVAFISRFSCPDFDHEANEKLSEILSSLK